jgi:hypothetical protein
MGIRLPRGEHDGLKFWRFGGFAGRLRLVRRQFGERYASGGTKEAERLGFVRHAWERVGVVPRLVGLIVLLVVAAGRSAGSSRGLEPGVPGRELVQLAVALPFGVPRQERAREPVQPPGLPSCPQFRRVRSVRLRERERSLERRPKGDRAQRSGAASPFEPKRKA